MKNKIIINKNANFFVFIGEISGARESDWSNERKKEWIIQSGGKLNNEEQSQIYKFKKIFDSVNYNLIEALFLSNDIKNIKKNISQKQFDELEKSFALFLLRFEKIWKKKEKNLLNLKKVLEKSDSRFGNALSKIERIYGVDNKTTLNKIPVQLLISSNDKNDILGYFSVTNRKTDIVLEYSGSINSEKNIFLNLVILHELSHLAVNKNRGLKNLIKKIAENNKNKIEKVFEFLPAEKTLEELIISSFVPEGYISKYFFKKNIKKITNYKNTKNQTNFTLLRQFCAYKMKIPAKEYLENNKKINKEYIQKVVNLI
jgi:hypothetical protein